MVKCIVCGAEVTRKCRNVPTCSKTCWSKIYKKTYKQPKLICKKCGNLGVIQGNGLCPKCYMKQYSYVKKVCSVCKKLKFVASSTIDGKPICRSCYKAPKKKCSVCGKIGVLSKKNPNICKKCYKSPKRTCSVCKKEKVIYDRKNKTCYVCANNEKICGWCGKKKKINFRYKNSGLCYNCYKKYRRNHDELFRIKETLGSRLRSAFKGAKNASKTYGISYQEIYDFLGPCPGVRSEWEIDHIFPLSAFNFKDSFEIWAAFHPTNHQWLRSEKNNKKRAKYDTKKFNSYLTKMKTIWRQK